MQPIQVVQNYIHAWVGKKSRQANCAGPDKTPGFFGWVGATIGYSHLTTTAWNDVDSIRKAMKIDPHQKAMGKFFGPELCASGYFSIWVPERISPIWVRCLSCGNMVSGDKAEGKCNYGAQLPEAPSYW
jgi:hypothetical protein